MAENKLADLSRIKTQACKDGFLDKVGLAKITHGDKNYEIYFTKKRANKRTVIRCENNTVVWEQFPRFPFLVGKRYVVGRSRGEAEPLIRLAPSKQCVRIFVVMGKPGCISGLDQGVFRSAHTFDEGYINVMSEKRFRELSLPGAF